MIYNTKIKEILNKLKSSAAGLSGLAASISDDELCRLVYPLFELPGMSRTEAVEYTKICLGVKDGPVIKFTALSEAKKSNSFIIDGSDLLYQDSDAADRANGRKNSQNSVKDRLNKEINDGIDNYLYRKNNSKDENSYLGNLAREYGFRESLFNSLKKCKIDPEDLLRNKYSIKYNHIDQDEILNIKKFFEKGYGYSDLNNLSNEYLEELKANGLNLNDIFGKTKEQKQLEELDEEGTDKAKVKTITKYSEGLDEEASSKLKASQVRIKEELKKKISELYARSTILLEILNTSMTKTYSDIIKSIAKLATVVGTLAANPFTSSASAPMLMEGISAIQDIIADVLKMLNEVEQSAIDIASELDALGGGPELSAKFIFIITMLNAITTIKGFFGGSSGGGSLLEKANTCQEKEGPEKVEYYWDFKKSFDLDEGTYLPGTKITNIDFKTVEDSSCPTTKIDLTRGVFDYVGRIDFGTYSLPAKNVDQPYDWNYSENKYQDVNTSNSLAALQIDFEDVGAVTLAWERKAWEQRSYTVANPNYVEGKGNTGISSTLTKYYTVYQANLVCSHSAATLKNYGIAINCSISFSESSRAKGWTEDLGSYSAHIQISSVNQKPVKIKKFENITFGDKFAINQKYAIPREYVSKVKGRGVQINHNLITSSKLLLLGKKYSTLINATISPILTKSYTKMEVTPVYEDSNIDWAITSNFSLNGTSAPSKGNESKKSDDDPTKDKMNYYICDCLSPAECLENEEKNIVNGKYVFEILDNANELILKSDGNKEFLVDTIKIIHRGDLSDIPELTQ